MNIFFAQLEDLNLRCYGNQLPDSIPDTAVHRQVFSRSAWRTKSGAAYFSACDIRDPSTGDLVTRTDTTWFSMCLGWGAYPTYDLYPFLVLAGPSGEYMYAVGHIGRRLQIRKYSAGVVEAGNGTGYNNVIVGPGPTIFSGAVVKIDVAFKYHATEGFIRVYGDGYLECEYVGDTTFAGVAGVRSMNILSRDNDSYSQTHFSECLIADADTRRAAVRTLYVTGAGDTNTAASGTYADIDDVAANDADSISFDTANQEANFGLVDMPPDGTNGMNKSQWVQHGVGVAARMSAGSGPQHAQLGVKIGTEVTDIFLSPDLTLDVPFLNFARWMPTSPKTTSTWTSSEIDGLLLHVKATT